MSISITHKFVSQKADSNDGSLIKPSNWNDDHIITMGGRTILGNFSDTPGEADGVIIGHGLVFEGNRLDASRPGRLVLTFGDTAPDGTLKANGAEVSRTAYARLFAKIGTRFGAGNGTTTFNLPDGRAMFFRGLDEGRGVDAGRVLGTQQESQNLSHNHSGSMGEAGWHGHSASADAGGNHQHGVNIPGDSWSEQNSNVISVSGRQMHTKTIWVATEWAGHHSHTVSVAGSGTHTHSLTIGWNGGNEARPVNLALLVCIEY